MIAADGRRGEGIGHSRRRERLIAAGVAGWLLLVAAVAIHSYLPPAPLPADAPAPDFSAARAMRHVRMIAGEPHRSGTAANRRVRDHLLGELRSLGLQPTIDVRPLTENRWLAHPENVLARIPGQVGGPAFMLAAHYDSVPSGPGAADNAAGVAALLETARALLAGPRPRHDVILFFPDAEERGLLGARQFLTHPWASETALMLNFEARGVSGPSFLYHTSDGNAFITAELQRVSDRVLSSSLMVSIYRAMPFRTDFDVLGERIPGMAVAFVDRFFRYHTRLDDPSHLDMGSLQHHGWYALTLTRHFANLDLTRGLTTPRRGATATMPADPARDAAARPPWFAPADTVHFNPIGGWVLRWPATVTPWFTGLLVSAWLLAVGRALRARRASLTGIAVGAGAVGLALTTALLLGGCVLALGLLGHGIYMLYNTNLYCAAGILMVIGIGIAQNDWWREVVPTTDRALGALLWWLPPLALATVWLPGGAFALQWPLAWALAGLFGSDLWSRAPPTTRRRGTAPDRHRAPQAGAAAVTPLETTATTARSEASHEVATIPTSAGEPWSGPLPSVPGPAPTASDRGDSRWRHWRWGWPILTFTPALLLWVPFGWALHQALTALFLPLLLMLVVAVGALSIPTIDRLAGFDTGRIARGSVAVGAAILAVAVGTGGPSAERPRCVALAWCIDADTQTGRWVSPDAVFTPWLQEFFQAAGATARMTPDDPPGATAGTAPEGTPAGSRHSPTDPLTTPGRPSGSPEETRLPLETFDLPGRYWQVDAGPAAKPTSIVQLLRDEIASPTGRRLSFTITPAADTGRIWLRCRQVLRALDCDGAPIGIEGISGRFTGAWELDWNVVAPRPATFTAEFHDGGTVVLTLIETQYRLPDLAARGLPPWPADLIPTPNTVLLGTPFDSGTTMIRSQVRF